VVPETIARFRVDASAGAGLPLRPVADLPHTFEPGRTPPALRAFEREPDWCLPTLSNRYPRVSADRETADSHRLEWVTPRHTPFEAPRRFDLHAAREPFAAGACFHALDREATARLDFYRARVWMGWARSCTNG